MKFKKKLNIKIIASVIDANLLPNDIGDYDLEGINSLLASGLHDLSFIFDAKYIPDLMTTKAKCIIVSEKMLNAIEFTGIKLVVNGDPRAALTKILYWYQNEFGAKTSTGLHPTVVVGDDTFIDPSTYIHPYCVIGNNVRIGKNCVLYPHVTIYDNTVLGDNVTIHANTVIGSDGFGFIQGKDNTWNKIPHLGGVIIGNNVEIGSNVSIDRGMVSDTIIGNSVIIDNLVQIAHNVQIGSYTAIAGCSAIAGSAVIGENVKIGGSSNIGGHIDIANNVIITGASIVSSSIAEAGVYSSGIPVTKNTTWRRYVSRVVRLDELWKKVNKIEVKLFGENI